MNYKLDRRITESSKEIGKKLEEFKKECENKFSAKWVEDNWKIITKLVIVALVGAILGLIITK